MEWVICLSVVPILLITLLFISGSIHKKVFSDAHFQEVAESLPALKQAAMDLPMQGQENPFQPTDPRSLLTSVGLAIVYTVSLHDGVFHHHISISLAARGYTAHAVGDMFMQFVARLLGVGIDRFRLGVSRATVHHGIFELSLAEHAAYSNRPVTVLTADELKAIREEWIKSRTAVRWERIPG